MAKTGSKIGKVRIGVIGLGIGHAHLEGYRLHPDAEIAAIADIDPVRLKSRAAEFNIPKTYTDYRKMLAECDLDGVSVCTPNHLHPEMAIAAFQAGCNVLCEKPIATSAAEAVKMVQAGQKSGKIFMMGFNNRFRGDTHVLKAHIDKGLLGDIYYAKTGWLRRRGIPGLGGWFTNKKLSGGGPLIDLGVHVLDLAMYLMGNPKPVGAYGATYAKFGPGSPGQQMFQEVDPAGVFDVEDLATALIRFQNGATIFLEASWASNVASERIYTTLMGTAGGADLDPLRIYTDLNGSQVDITPQYPNLNGHQREVIHFVDCIKENRQPISTGQHGLDVIKVLDAIYQSAETGQMSPIS